MRVHQFRFWLGITVAFLACGWVAFAKLVMRPVIERAYYVESLPFLNHIIVGLGKPLDLLLLRWDSFTQAGLLICLGFGLVSLMTTSPTFFQWYVGEATPESLGAIRIITCTFLFGHTLLENFSSITLLPTELRQPMGVMQFFHALPIGFENFVESEISLKAFKLLTLVILFLGIIGLQTRIAIPIGAFCYLLLTGLLREYSGFWHTGIVPLYLMMVLSFTPCGDGLSLDRFWKVYQGRAVPMSECASPIYCWSRYACWTVIALTYVAAGMSKLANGGLFWWDSTNMRAMLYQASLEQMRFGWGLALHLGSASDILLALLGISTLIGELVFGLVLFSRIARWTLPLIMLMMHIGIFFLMEILFFDLIVMQIAFYDIGAIPKAIGCWLAKLITFVPRSESAVTTNNAHQDYRYPLLVSSLSMVLLLCWCFRVEFYPFTAVQMFSERNTSGVITYQKLFSYHESGSITRPYIQDVIGGMSNTRHKVFTRKCFQPTQVHLCKKFLSAVSSAYNHRANPGEAVTQFELQQWSWDFRNDPSNPQYGDLMDRFILKLPS